MKPTIASRNRAPRTRFGVTATLADETGDAYESGIE
jgi:hypothetical protein